MSHNRKHLWIIRAVNLTIFMAAMLCLSRPETVSARPRGTYTNPIIPGDYPDVSVIKVGHTYFMTNTSEAYTPGLLIWRSTNLVNWTPVAHALKQCDGLVAAPDLTVYRHRFYIYYTPGRSTHVIYSKHIGGPWSKPIKLRRGGRPFAAFDPFFIAGPHGTPHLVGAGDYIVRLARDGLSVVGKRHFIYKGWPIPKRWDVECSCLEGPKILFHHGFYYLFSAEGGTSGPPTSHMVVVARSRNLRGPWQNSPFNPLVHTYSRHDTWWSTGHGTVIQAPDKKWYVIFHGYRRHYLTLGRSVLMEPVRWTKSGWLKLLLGTRPSLPLPIPESNAIQRPMNLSDNFAGHKLGLQWQFWGPVPAGRFSLANHTLRLKAVGPGIASSSPLLCMAIARAYSITVSVTVHPGTKAGLVLYYDPSEYISVGIGDGDWWFGQHGHSSGAGRFTAHHAVVRIVNDHNAIEMYVGKTVDTLRKVGISLYAGGYTTQTFGGYLSLRPGLYATGKGTAVFRHFKYSLIHRRTRSRFRR